MSLSLSVIADCEKPEVVVIKRGEGAGGGGRESEGDCDDGARKMLRCSHSRGVRRIQCKSTRGPGFHCKQTAPQ